MSERRLRRTAARVLAAVAATAAPAIPAAEAMGVQAEMVLLVSGGVRDGEIVLGPAFAYEGAPSPPEAPGPYRLRGLDAEGTVLFCTTLQPGELSHGGSAFTVALPFEPTWTEALDRIELRGPEGVAALDRSDGARAALIRDRATGQVRAILRDAPAADGLPPALAADSASLEIIRGLPRPPG